MKKVTLYVLAAIICFYIVLNLSGCLRFRMSHGKADKFFSHAPVKVHFYTDTIKPLNRTLYYAQTDNEDKPVYILFVHGSPGSGSNFYEYLKNEQLLDLAQLAAVDRPGFGFSNFGKSLPDIALQADCLAEILKHHTGQKIILLGHSMGGPIIVETAIRYPQLVSGLFVLAGNVDPNLEPKEPWRKPFASPWLRWMLPGSMRVSNEEILPVKKQLKEMEEKWDQVKCPVYVLQGEKDMLVPAGNADFIKNRLPVEQTTIIKLKGKNHFIPFSDPDILTSNLIKFIHQVYGS